MKTTAARTETTPVEIRRESRHFFFCCPNLDLWAVGRTREEAEMNLREEILLLLAKCRMYLDAAEAGPAGGYATVELRPC